MTKHRPAVSTLLCLLAALTVQASLSAAPAAAEEQANRYFELRIYTTHPGKLDALHQRFREHTNRIFKKHGMQLVGYWTPSEGDEAQNKLIYILAYPDRAARDKAWEAFRADPDWQRVYKESREDGPIVMKVENKFLAPTDYSPIK